mgnify:CR=1 FL=1
MSNNTFDFSVVVNEANTAKAVGSGSLTLPTPRLAMRFLQRHRLRL